MFCKVCYFSSANNLLYFSDANSLLLKKIFLIDIYMKYRMHCTSIFYSYPVTVYHNLFNMQYAADKLFEIEYSIKYTWYAYILYMRNVLLCMYIFTPIMPLHSWSLLFSFLLFLHTYFFHGILLKHFHFSLCL